MERLDLDFVFFTGTPAARPRAPPAERPDASAPPCAQSAEYFITPSALASGERARSLEAYTNTTDLYTSLLLIKNGAMHRRATEGLTTKLHAGCADGDAPCAAN